jgi:catechol 2,3-dioxygenase-like lactoylglutathione lyase family enzyme
VTEILGVAEAVLYVTNLERATQFYTEVLGLPVTAAFDDARFLQTGPHSTLILFDIDRLQQRDSIIPDHGARGRGHVALSIPAEEMDAWRQQLVDHGVEIEHEQEWSLGTHSIYFRDPDGNSLELIDGRHYQQVWDRVQSG